MCGIAGVLSFSGRPVDVERLTAMSDRLSHRGPDGAGLWIAPDRRVGLAHRRLSIIDLSTAASQPMSNETGELQIVFNGEIYNHAEIRAELVGIGGHRWKTDHSDTEMILHAYEEWGIDCIQRFRGMFAFALYDHRDRSAWLVRDRIGIKPLYYAVVDGQLRFASEIKAILSDPAVPRRVCREAVYHYLSFLASPAPTTFFEGINKLPAATCLRVRLDGTMQERRYWDAWDHVAPLTSVSDADIADRLLEELRISVRYRQVSDVPVGVFLSGGIDSSTNTALFSRGDSPVKTFSIGYDTQYSSYRDELDYAARMAAEVGAEHHVRRLGVDDLLRFLPQMIYHQDEPIGDVVCVPLYYVSKLAHDSGVIVCQVGEGADELFCGYPLWKAHLQLARLDALPVPRAAKRLAMTALRWAGRNDSYVYECLRRSTTGDPLFWGGAEGLTHVEKQRVIGPALEQFRGVSSGDALRPIRERFEQNAWEKTPLHWMTYLDLNLRLPELLLMRVDKMTMATSLEGRVPFLDHRFVEFALSIPTAVKVRNGELKHILKRAVRGVIPDELIDRKKQGFGVPLQDWLFDRLGQTVRVELDRFCEQTGLLDGAEVRDYIDRGKGSKVWQLFNLALWHKRFIDNPLPDVPRAQPVLSASA